MEKETRRSLHISEAQKLLDTARIYRQQVDITAWSLADEGRAIRYQNWTVTSGNWHGGWHKIRNPRNGEIRTLPDIFIIRLNGHPIHL